jgi:DNA-binding CsgD family transcriptional regulator
MARNDQRVHIRQLCCLGLPAEQLMPRLLKAVRELVGADSAGFFWVDAQGEMTGLYAERVLSAPAMQLYFERYYQSGELSFKESFARRLAQGEPVTAASPSPSVERSEIYNEVYRALDAHHVMYGIVRSQGRALGQLSLYRPRSAAPFSAIDRRGLSSVLAYVEHGVARRASAGAGFGEFVDSDDDAVFMVDIDGCVPEQSSAAVKLLALATSGGIGPAQARGGVDAGAQQVLKRLVDGVRDALEGRDGPPPRAVATNAWGRFVLRAYAISDAPLDRESRIAVSISRQEPLLLRFVGALGALGLSPQQREVALGVARGASNRELAQSLGISLNTVAYHVKQLFIRLQAHDRQQVIERVMDAQAR